MEEELIDSAEFPCENTFPEWFGNRKIVLNYMNTTHMPSDFICDRIVTWMEKLSRTNGTHTKSFYSFVATYIVDDDRLYLELNSKKLMK